jgi:hypothetical protein
MDTRPASPALGRINKRKKKERENVDVWLFAKPSGRMLANAGRKKKIKGNKTSIVAEGYMEKGQK